VGATDVEPTQRSRRSDQERHVVRAIRNPLGGKMPFRPPAKPKKHSIFAASEPDCDAHSSYHAGHGLSPDALWGPSHTRFAPSSWRAHSR